MSVPRWYAAAGPAYLAVLLAVDTHAALPEQLALGVLTWAVLLAALRPLPALARAQALGVVAFATAGEVTGSLVWGVYRYRLHNLPLFIPPAHGLVYLSGLALGAAAPRRALVAAAALGSAGWGVAGLTVLPRLPGLKPAQMIVPVRSPGADCEPGAGSTSVSGAPIVK